MQQDHDELREVSLREAIVEQQQQRIRELEMRLAIATGAYEGGAPQQQQQFDDSIDQPLPAIIAQARHELRLDAVGQSWSTSSSASAARAFCCSA